MDAATPSQHAPQLRPIAPESRSFTLDALRGFALLGVILANMPGFAWTGWADLRGEQIWPEAHNVAALWALRWLVWGKFNSLFSLLFGVGFALQLERITSSRRAPTGPYLRRVAVLLGLGLTHAIVIWHGDVLMTYAEIGLVLLLIRKIPTRWVLPLALAAFLASPVIAAVDATLSSPERAKALLAEALVHQHEYDDAVARGTLRDTVVVRAKILHREYTRLDSVLGMVSWRLSMLATTLLGLYAARRRLLTEPSSHLALWRKTFWGSLVVGLVALAAMSYLRQFWRPGVMSMLDVARGTFYTVQRPAMMLVYLSGIVLLLQRAGMRRAMAAVATMGRMPLTNYLAHSIVFTTVFYHYGLGMYGAVGPAWCSVMAIGLWCVLLAISHIWLARFEHGPLEWVWKLVTYGAAPRMVRRARSGQEPVAAVSAPPGSALT